MEGITFFFDWEVALMQWVQAHLGALAPVASVLSMFGEELILIAILGFVYWCLDKEFGIFIGVNVVTGVVLNPMLKNLIPRRRPYFDHEGIACLKPVDSSADIYDIAAQGYSFPSGHSSNAVIVYGSLAAVRPRSRVLRIVAVALPLLVGLSRVMLGVHYPTDVLCGWALGGIVVLLFSLLQRKINNQNLFRSIVFLLSLTGMFYCRTTDYYTGLGLMAGLFLAIPFEARFVRFRPTRNALRCVLRVVFGIGLFLGLNTILKLPFSESFLTSGTLGAYLARTLRYAVVSFLLLGVYPLAFDRIPFSKAKTL